MPPKILHFWLHMPLQELSRSWMSHLRIGGWIWDKEFISLLDSFSSNFSSGSSSTMRRIISKAFRTSFFLIVFKLLCCCSISRDTLSGRVSESTMPCNAYQCRYAESTGVGKSESGQCCTIKWTYLYLDPSITSV
jgi:hypothetical protein